MAAKKATKKKKATRSKTKRPVAKAAKRTTKSAAKKGSTKKAAGKAAKKNAASRKKTTSRKNAGVRKGVKKASVKKTAGKKTAAKKKTAKKKTTVKSVTKTKKAVVKKKSAGVKKKASSRKAAGAQVAAAGAAPKPRRVSARLSAKDLDRFRQMLLEKRREIMGDVTTLRDEALHKTSQEASGNLSNMPQHMAELGSDNYEQEFALMLVEGERRVITEIDEALKRIENGTFGICEATGRPIGKARLRAKPWAKYCYEYVLAQETGRGI